MQTTVAGHSGMKGRFGVRLTRHAAQRMCDRSMPSAAVAAAIDYGRVVRVRGADIHAIGRKEVERYRCEGVELAQFEGVQVVCDSGGTIITVYRNRDFRALHQIKSRQRRNRGVR